MSFYFAKSVDALGEPDFKASIVEAMEESADCLLLFKHFPWLQSVVSLLPTSLAVVIIPQTSGIGRVVHILSTRVKQLMANPSSLEECSHPVIFKNLLQTEANSKEVALNERSLLQESQSLLFGGSETVSNQIMLGTWHLLESPDNVRRLKSELLKAWPALDNTPSLEDLERLPFLVISRS
jgi:hypothetical protein